MNKSNIKLRLNLIFFLIYASMGCFYPYLFIYFNSRNLTYTQIGICFSINSLLSIISQPIWGYITDKYLTKKITIIITTAASSIFVFLLSFASNFSIIIVLLILLGIFQSSIWSILDAFCYEIIDTYKNIEFGKVKVNSSAGYAICVLLTGFIIKYTSISVISYLNCGINIIALIVLFSIKFKENKHGQGITLNDVFILFRNRRFMLFILSIAILNIPMSANCNYIGDLIKSTGGDVSNLGLLWFVIAFSEIPAFTLGGRILNRISDLKLYFLSIIIYSIRYFLDSMCTSYIIVILLQLMQGISYPLFIIAIMQYLNKIVPKYMQTSGMTLYYALGGGLGGLIGNLGGGLLLEKISIFYLFKILSFVTLAALLVGLMIEKSSNKNYRGRPTL